MTSPPESVKNVFWFAFATFLIATVLIYVAAEWLPRKHRLFHYILTLVAATSCLAHLVLAGTYLGFVVEEGELLFFYVRSVDLAVTFPLLLLLLGLFSGTRLPETLFIAAITPLVFVSQMMVGLHTESNRWLFFVLNLLLAVPALSALTSGFRAQAQLRHGAAVAARVGHMSLVVLLYLIIVELFVLLTACLHYIDADKDAVSVTLADVVVKVSLALFVLFSPDLVATAVDHDPVLQALCSDLEGEAEEGEPLETGGPRGYFKMKGSDPLHMKPEATERTSLRGKV